MTIDLTQRICDAATATLELFAVHLGRELGLYEVLDRHGPLDVTALSERAGIAERYAREWLEQQAVAGFLIVAGDAEEGDHHGRTRTYALPAAHRGALIDPVDADHVAPMAAMVVGIAGVLDHVTEAYRTGGGVPYHLYGADFRHGQGGVNRPAFTSDLVKVWLPAVEGVTEHLAGGGRVLDIGAGHGWSTIAMKAAWPAATVIGLDTDRASVDDARRHAEAAGVDARFETIGGEDELARFGPVEVVTIMEALHDMSRPVEVLAAARGALVPGGVVVVADEAVAETFAAPGDDLERMMYGWSVTHCLPAAMAEQPSAALGTVLRPGTVAEVAAAAGFASCEIVDVDAGFFRIYRLTA